MKLTSELYGMDDVSLKAYLGAQMINSYCDTRIKLLKENLLKELGKESQNETLVTAIAQAIDFWQTMKEGVVE